jgi:hypothetical protein
VGKLNLVDLAGSERQSKVRPVFVPVLVLHTPVRCFLIVVFVVE